MARAFAFAKVYRSRTHRPDWLKRKEVAQFFNSGWLTFLLTFTQVAPTDYNERNHPIGENRMSLDRLSEQYYTAAEARHVLGLTEHSFQAWVRAGKITKVILPGR